MNNFGSSPYHYVPSESTAIIFIVLFGLSTGKKVYFALSASALVVLNLMTLVVHLGYATFYRMWWLFPTIGLCGVLEIVGWSGRLWSSFSPLLGAPFKMQSVFQYFISSFNSPTNHGNNNHFRIVATILGPTPLLAANFVIFGVLIHRLGFQYSRLSPKTCKWAYYHVKSSQG